MMLGDDRQSIGKRASWQLSIVAQLFLAFVLGLVGVAMLFASSIPPTASAATILVVSNTGSDVVGCGTTAAPCATVQYAHDSLLFNTNIQLRRGEIFNQSAIITHPVTIEPEPGAAATPILRGNGIAGTQAILNVKASNVTIQGVEFQNPNAGFSYTQGAIYMDDVNYSALTVQNNTFTSLANNGVAIGNNGSAAIMSSVIISGNIFNILTNPNPTNGNAMYLRNVNNLTVANNTIQNTAASAIIMDSVQTGIVSNNVITGAVAIDGIAIRSALRSSSGLTVQNNTIRGATGAAFHISGNNAANGLNINLNNTFGGAGANVLIDAGTTLTGAVISNNRLFGNAALGTLINNSAATVNATNNWWGSNASAASRVSGSGAASVNVGTWLGLRVTTTPNPISAGGATSTVTADFVSCAAVPCPATPALGAGDSFYNGTLNTLPNLTIPDLAIPGTGGSTAGVAAAQPAPAPAGSPITRSRVATSGNASGDVQYSALFDLQTTTSVVNPPPVAPCNAAQPALPNNGDLRISNACVDLIVTKGATRIPSNAAVTAVLGGASVLPPADGNDINVAAGEQVQYVITVSNGGTGTAKNIPVTDTFPVGLTNITWTCSAAAPSSCSSPTGTGNIASNVTVGPGGAVIFIATATVPATTLEATAFTNIASVPNTAPALAALGVEDFNLLNNVSTVGNGVNGDPIVTARKVADIGITKTILPPNAAGGSLPSGSTFTYRITIRNNGPSSFTEATGGTNLPRFIDFLYNPNSVTGTYSYTCSGTCAPVPGAAAAIPGGAAPVTLIPDTEVQLAAGASINIDVTFNISGASPPGNLYNQARVSFIPFSGFASLTGAPAVGTFTPGPTLQPPTGYPATGNSRDPVVVACAAQTGDNSCNGDVIAPPITVTASADLSVSKSRTSASPVTAGTPIQYTVVIANNGPAPINPGLLSFSDIFTTPADIAGQNIVSCAPAGGADCGGITAGAIAFPYTATAPTVTIPPGGTLTVVIAGTTNAASAGNTITNTATVTFTAASGYSDPNLLNNTSSVVDKLGSNADVSVVKTVSVPAAPPYNAGSAIQFQIVVANNAFVGATTISGVTVADTFVATLLNPTLVSCTPAGGAVCGTQAVTSSVFSATTGTIPVGGTLTYLISATIDPFATGSINNTTTATIPPGSTDPNLGNNTSTIIVPVTSTSSVTVNKTGTLSTPAFGNLVTYTIAISNTGPSGGAGINLNDPVPSEVIAPAWSCTAPATSNCGSTPSGFGTPVSSTGIQVAPNDIVTFTITGTLSFAASGTFTNTVNLTGGATATSSFPLNVGNVSNLQIDKVGTTGTINNPGGVLTYTLSVNNGGPNDVSGATVSDVFDPARIASVQWSCSVVVAVSVTSCGATPTGTGNINTTVNVGVGGQLTYIITPTLLTGATGLLTNTAVISPPVGTTDPTPADNQDTVVNNINGPPPVPDLLIAKVANSPVFTVGQNASYSITVSNPITATGGATPPITLTDTLPTGITYVSFAGTGWLCSAVNPNITCLYNGAPLAAGSSTTVTFTVAVGSAAFGTTAVNTATVSTGQAEVSTANNTASSAPVTVNRVLQLTVVSGTPQSAVINTAFGLPLVARLTDSTGTAVSGATITFAAPGSGASAVLGGGATATTDASGLVTKTVTANAVTGTYSVTATTTGVATPISYNLTNTATPPPPPPGSQIKLLSATVRIATSVGKFAPLKATGTTPSNPPNISSISIQVTGANGIPTNAIGLVGTLTNVGCTAGGNLRFWAGTSIPNSTNLNVPGAKPELNLTTNFVVGLDATGKVNLGLASGDLTAQCDYLVDAVGYLSPAGTGNVTLLSNTFRIASTFPTNNNPTLTSTGLSPSNPANSSTFTIQAGGVSGIPANAVGIFGVLTNVGCTGGANFRFWSGNTVPFASNLNVPGLLSSLNLSTGFIAPLDATGKVKLGLGAGITTSCGYAVDVSGYVLAPTLSGDLQLLASSYRAAFTNAPTNNPTITSTGKDPANPPNASTFDILAASAASGVPTGSPGIFGVVTNVSCTGGGNFRFWAGSVTSSGVNLNIPGSLPGLNLSSGFTTPINPVTGRVNLGVGSGTPVTCGYVVDITGFFRP